VRAETAHAALVFDGDDCLGWCQFGVPDELPRIKSRAAYERGRTTSPDWRIACCYVGKGHRRQGVATAALAGALDLIAGQGGGRVEGYPEDAASVPAGFLYNGALSTYETLGFTRDRKIGKHPLGRHEGHRALVVADGGSPYDMARRARCGLRDSAPSGSATGMIRNVESVGSCLRERRLVGVRLDFGPRRLGWMVEVPPHRVVDPLLRIAHRPPE